MVLRGEGEHGRRVRVGILRDDSTANGKEPDRPVLALDLRGHRTRVPMLRFRQTKHDGHVRFQRFPEFPLELFGACQCPISLTVQRTGAAHLP
ncbi:hypothetical protein D3C71_2045490 [compost metagenome]